MADYTEEELALLSDEEREALLDEGDDEGEDTGEDTSDETGDDTGDSGDGAATDDDADEDGDGDGDGDEDGADPDADDPAEDDGQQQTDDGQGEEGGEDAADGDDEGPQQPSLSVEARLPENWKTQMDEVLHKQKALRTQYDDGEIDDTEYDKEFDALRQEEKRLDRIYTKAEFAAEQHEKELAEGWIAEVRKFYDDYPHFKPTDMENPENNENPLYDAMDKQVRRIAASNPGLSNKAVLEKALARFPESVRNPDGKKPADTGDTGNGKTGGKQRRQVPTTLRNVPASQTTETDDGGKFAYLDKLDSLALEKELAKMSESEKEAYMAQ